MGFLDKFKFDRLKEGLATTRENIFGKVQKILLGRGKVDDEFLEKLEEILITADVGVATTTKIIENLKHRVWKELYTDSAELDAILREEIHKQFANGSDSNTDPFILPATHKPHVIMVVGVNGVGKTTTIGKLAFNYRTAGKKVLIAAADTFRAAANEQLEIWATRAGVEIISQSHGADPASVAYDALKSAQSRGADVMIIDTAGRLHTKINLMEELKKISRVLQKLVPEAPHEVLLVLDASTGQNAIQQAKQFTAAANVTGLVITKLDGTAKGGVVFAVSEELRVPVKFIGVGEKIDDLQPFDKNAFVDALFGK
ncbi:MAG: signal recognition particle-docking protein FtsY [Bacteroidota bacterium]